MNKCEPPVPGLVSGRLRRTLATVHESAKQPTQALETTPEKAPFSDATVLSMLWREWASYSGWGDAFGHSQRTQAIRIAQRAPRLGQASRDPAGAAGKRSPGSGRPHHAGLFFCKRLPFAPCWRCARCRIGHTVYRLAGLIHALADAEGEGSAEADALSMALRRDGTANLSLGRALSCLVDGNGYIPTLAQATITGSLRQSHSCN